ncbi:HTH-type transcriptional regulator ZntR [compost metagenome]
MIKLYRIGELAKAASVSERTIDYYTKLKLITPEARTQKNYRLYSAETLNRLKRINELKQEKYTLKEIRSKLELWNKVSHEEQVTEKLTSLEIHMQRLEREVKELEPGQARKMYSSLMPQSLACIDALYLLINQGPFT